MESSEFCRDVLRCRMEEGHLPKAEIHDDITEMGPALKNLKGQVDVISAGFPCQAELSHESHASMCLVPS